MEEIIAVSEMEAPTKGVAQTELSVEGLMMESAMDSVGASSKTEEEKEKLNRYIEEMMKKEDPFEAVRYAISTVVPQVMTYQEANLEETADDFNVVNDLNNKFADMMGNFGASGSKAVIDSGNKYGGVEGVERGLLYFKQAEDYIDDVETQLPSTIGATISEQLREITSATYGDVDPATYGTYGRPVALYNGMNGLDQMAVHVQPTDGQDANLEGYQLAGEWDYDSKSIFDTESGRSQPYELDKVHGDFANRLNDNNTVITTSLNGYSKEVEAEFKFSIEEYGQYLSLSSQLYDTGTKGVQVHVRDQKV